MEAGERAGQILRVYREGELGSPPAISRSASSAGAIWTNAIWRRSDRL